MASYKSIFTVSGCWWLFCFLFICAK